VAIKGDYFERQQNQFLSISCVYVYIGRASEYQISKDIGWVSQNTTLYYDVRCHRVDDMFRPFTIRPLSGLTLWKLKRKITMLHTAYIHIYIYIYIYSMLWLRECNVVIFLFSFHHVRPDDGLIVKGRNMSPLHHNKVLCFDSPTRYLLIFDIVITHSGDEPLKDRASELYCLIW